MEFDNELAIGAALGMGGFAGQMGEVFIDAGDLEGDGTGIGFIGKEKIEDGGGFEAGEIAAAVGKGTVGDIEQGVEEREFVGGDMDQDGAKEPGEGQTPFESHSHVEEAPSQSAGHRIGRHPAEGQVAVDEVVEQFENVGDAVVADSDVDGGEFAIGFAEDLPGIHGNAIAEDARRGCGRY